VNRLQYLITENELYRCIPEPGETEAVIPENVKKINWNAFLSCNTVRRIQLPESIRKIPNGTFSYCFGMKRLSIGTDLHFEFDFRNFKTGKITEIEYQGQKLQNPPVRPEQIGIFYRRIRKKKFSDIQNADEQKFFWCVYFFQPEHKKIRKCLRKNFDELYPVLLKDGNAEILRVLLEHTELVTEQNIHLLIQKANTYESYALQMMLTDYQYQHFNFPDITKNLKL